MSALLSVQVGKFFKDHRDLLEEFASYLLQNKLSHHRRLLCKCRYYMKLMAKLRAGQHSNNFKDLNCLTAVNAR